MNNSIILSAEHLHKQFQQGPSAIEIFRDLHLTIQRGECVAIIGASGTGKSTLLHLLGGLDLPSSGKVSIQGIDITEIHESERCRIRNETLGFVYQFHHILPEFTVLENVCMPLLIRGIPQKQAEITALTLLEKIGLDKRTQHKLSELSGGERQRTAIARALVTQPLCVLADEPTGNLDPVTAERVYSAMLELNQALQTSLVIVTHDERLAKRMDRVLRLENGTLAVVN